MKKFIYLFAAAALLLGTAACSGSGSADKNAADSTAADSTATATVKEPAAKPANLIELAGDELAQLNAAEGQVLAIDFGATWCGPCQKFHPTFDEAAAKYPAVKFVYVDVDENPGAAEKYNVEAVPTIIVVDNKGKETRYTGIDELLPSEKFFSIIENASK